MKKMTILAAFATGVILSAAASEEVNPPKRIFDETEQQRAERLSWWINDRFGMFIHFGLYSVPGRHEWVMSLEAIDADTYEKRYFPRFNPDLFDAKLWAKTAKAAGMKYAVLTTKHHEGFCMWDTATTDYKITKTAFGRDVVREFVDAFRAEGLKVGFYFSIMDWHHPDYTVDHPHPLFKKIKGDDRLILIADAFVEHGPIPADDLYEGADDINFDFSGEIAGSKMILDGSCRNMMVHTGASLCQVFKYASTNPATMLGLTDRGRIAVGNVANPIAVDPEFEIKQVYSGGRYKSFGKLFCVN